MSNLKTTFAWPRFFRPWYYALSLMCMLSSQAIAQQQLKPWKAGYLDIHQIATGRGNSAFAILPDGTTLLIDAGDLGNRVGLNQVIMPALPNASKLPGEWIARYIKHFNPASTDKRIDYALLTHFHNDHMGGFSENAISLPDRNYVLSGITHVAELLPIHKIIDRGYPNYNYPSRAAVESTSRDFNNYLKFIAYQQATKKTIFEGFEVASNTQFKLLYKANKYPEFNIQNIYSNGKLWTGEGNKTKNLFPDLTSLAPADYPNENILSNAIKLTYGKFSYYSGGDVTGMVSANKPAWRDVETPIGEIVGRVAVAVLNHHGYSDAMNSAFVKKLSPKAFVIPVWDYYHPQPETLDRILNAAENPRQAAIYATGLVDANKERLGQAAQYIQPYGHIVIRVYAGGGSFQVFVLNAHSENYEIIAKIALIRSAPDRPLPKLK